MEKQSLNVANGDQFNAALAALRHGGTMLDGGLKSCCGFIHNAGNYVQQQDFLKRTATAYQEAVKFTRPDLQFNSAVKTVRNATVQLFGTYRLGSNGKVQRKANGQAIMDYAWLKSDSADSIKKAGQRGKRVSVATKTLKTGTIAPAPAPVRTWHPSAWRSELIAAIKTEVESASAVMAPSELSQLQSLLAAFTASLAAIPVPKPVAKGKKA